jgi:hypothetical protein
MGQHSRITYLSNFQIKKRNLQVTTRSSRMCPRLQLPLLTLCPPCPLPLNQASKVSLCFSSITQSEWTINSIHIEHNPGLNWPNLAAHSRVYTRRVEVEVSYRKWKWVTGSGSELQEVEVSYRKWKWLPSRWKWVTSTREMSEFNHVATP